MGLRIDADGASNIEIAAELSPILIEVEGCFLYISALEAPSLATALSNI